jgi:radical SAM-linked protein
VDGDLRFASHHDTMRALARAAARACLPLAYSRGFNPRPRMSLPCPRPVAVAASDELLVLSLEGDPDDPARLLDDINRCCPPGLRCLRAGRLQGKAKPQCVRADYEMPLADSRRDAAAERLAALAAEASWPLRRRVRAKRRGAGPAERTIDLRPLVGDLRLEGGWLRWSQSPGEGVSARPGEVVGLVGLDPAADLAAVVRTRVEFEPPTVTPGRRAAP